MLLNWYGDQPRSLPHHREGASFNTIQRQLQTSAPPIIRWKLRFLASGIDGLDTYHPGQKATFLTPALRASGLARSGPEAAPFAALFGQPPSRLKSKAADIIGLYLNPLQHAV